MMHILPAHERKIITGKIITFLGDDVKSVVLPLVGKCDTRCDDVFSGVSSTKCLARDANLDESDETAEKYIDSFQIILSQQSTT